MQKAAKKKPPTIREVAARAGVSMMTASRAINGKALVSAKSQQAVEQAVKDLGYVPNASARAATSRIVGGFFFAAFCIVHLPSHFYGQGKSRRSGL
jgi:DNA-binding LacI/PurR family transcriptional regulator